VNWKLALFLDEEEEPMTLKVILEKGADGYIIAECPQIPGCMSQGKTKEEALANIKDAVQACLKVMMEDLIAASTVPAAIPAPEGAEERRIMPTLTCGVLSMPHVYPRITNACPNGRHGGGESWKRRSCFTRKRFQF